MAFLPINMEDIITRGWDKPDFILVTADAYVDHPSFGIAIISRVLEANGFKVAILSQPDVNTNTDFTRFGEPTLGFLVTSGNIDSMVSNYTVAKNKRKEDVYSPGGIAGKRPDRAVIVYSKKIREIYPDSPIILGGLEASLRRFAHYDYWDDKILPSVLVSSGADLLTYGMGENQTIELANRLKNGESIKNIRDIRGTCYLVLSSEYKPGPATECASLEAVINSKKEYAVSCRKQQDEQDPIRGKTVIQKHGKLILVQNPPMHPLNQDELDAVYSLPFERTYHPIYKKLGGVPGIEEVEFSITHNRGCFGACNFCSIAFHQGRMITSRSKKSIMEEAKSLTTNPGFKGYIHDVGGPTANFRHMSCKNQETTGLCKGKKCLAPTACKNLYVDHSEYLDILRSLRKLEKVKKVFIRSGIRFDYINEDKNDSFFKELIEHHISGQLKVAPEHCSPGVLDKMGKPHIEAYRKFSDKFYSLTKKLKKEQYLVPYLMSSHPGSTLNDAIELALFLKKEKIKPQQVQDFYPTPGTISTCMFYTGLDPYTLKEVYVPKSKEEKAMQRALLQYFMPQNKKLVLKALNIAKRQDLIPILVGKTAIIQSNTNYAKRTGTNKPKVKKGRKY